MATAGAMMADRTKAVLFIASRACHNLSLNPIRFRLVDRSRIKSPQSAERVMAEGSVAARWPYASPR